MVRTTIKGRGEWRAGWPASAVAPVAVKHQYGGYRLLDYDDESVLAADDDFLNDVLLDTLAQTMGRPLGVHKNLPNYQRVPHDENQLLTLVKELIVLRGSVHLAVDYFTQLPYVRAYIEGKTEKELLAFKGLATTYFNLYTQQNPFEIGKTDRYSSKTGKVELAVYATRSVERGSLIQLIEGALARLSPQEEARLTGEDPVGPSPLEHSQKGMQSMSPESSGSVAAGRSVKGKEKAGSSEPRAAGAMNVVAALDFSLVLSSSKQCWMRFNGPGRFLNHDCDANARLRGLKNGITFDVIRKLNPGEELTCDYGTNYFGPDNRDCMCATCERRGEGYWKLSPSPPLVAADFVKAESLAENSPSPSSTTGGVDDAPSLRTSRRGPVRAQVNLETHCEKCLGRRDPPIKIKLCPSEPRARGLCPRCARHWIIYGQKWPYRPQPVKGLPPWTMRIKKPRVRGLPGNSTAASSANPLSASMKRPCPTKGNDAVLKAGEDRKPMTGNSGDDENDESDESDDPTLLVGTATARSLAKMDAADRAGAHGLMRVDKASSRRTRLGAEAAEKTTGGGKKRRREDRRSYSIDQVPSSDPNMIALECRIAGVRLIRVSCSGGLTYVNALPLKILGDGWSPYRLSFDRLEIEGVPLLYAQLLPGAMEGIWVPLDVAISITKNYGIYPLLERFLATKPFLGAPPAPTDAPSLKQRAPSTTQHTPDSDNDEIDPMLPPPTGINEKPIVVPPHTFVPPKPVYSTKKYSLPPPIPKSVWAGQRPLLPELVEYETDYGDESPASLLCYRAEVMHNGTLITLLRRTDGWLHLSSLLHLAGLSERQKAKVYHTLKGKPTNVWQYNVPWGADPQPWAGIWCPRTRAMALCEHFGLSDLVKNLLLPQSDLQKLVPIDGDSSSDVNVSPRTKFPDALSSPLEMPLAADLVDLETKTETPEDTEVDQFVGGTKDASFQAPAANQRDNSESESDIQVVEILEPDGSSPNKHQLRQAISRGERIRPEELDDLDVDPFDCWDSALPLLENQDKQAVFQQGDWSPSKPQAYSHRDVKSENGDGTWDGLSHMDVDHPCSSGAAAPLPPLTSDPWSRPTPSKASATHPSSSSRKIRTYDINAKDDEEHVEMEISFDEDITILETTASLSNLAAANARQSMPPTIMRQNFDQPVVQKKLALPETLHLAKKDHNDGEDEVKRIKAKENFVDLVSD